MFQTIRDLEKKVGLPDGFYSRLLEDDHWSFVIKLNALVEAACTHALSARFHAPELAPAFASIDLGNGKFGKIVLLKRLNAITSAQASILQTLYELRNSLAHNITNVGFTFEAHFTSLDKQQRANFLKHITHGLGDGPIKIARKASPEDFAKENMRLCVWLTIAEILACIHLEHQVAEVQLEKLALDALSKKHAKKA
jgi:hypothetical protein